jgi:xylan 1,4-beta-xylosidase
VRHYRIDATHSNSHTVWQDQGAPQDPTPEQLAAITARQGLEKFAGDTRAQVDGVLNLQLDLPLPSLSLVVLTKVA